MAKCSICGRKIEVTFLNKIIGTYIKDKNGKMHAVCLECQKKFDNKEDILTKI